MPRYATKISKKELEDKIIQIIKNHEDYDDELSDEAILEYNEEYDCNPIDRCGYIIRNLSEAVDKDLSKVDFDLENFTCDSKEYKNRYYCGFITLDNGFSYLGCEVGGDWEHPIYFIVYWDGEKLRGYIPKLGNIWNQKIKSAFGNSNEDSVSFISQYKKFPLGFDQSIIDRIKHNENDYSDFIDLIHDNELIMQDIKARIILK